VQNRVHPDKFVSATDAEKRVAMQWATRANEAYQTLKNPQQRAQYMCELLVWICRPNRIRPCRWLS
jgi:molecular chaperone HscB